MQKYTLNNLEYEAEDCIEGVLINPVLPSDFFETPTISRSTVELNLWWCIPFIQTTGAVYKVLCLDGETSNSPSISGYFENLEDALDWAKSETMLLGEIPTNTSKEELFFLKMSR